MPNEEHIKVLRKGVEAWNSWRASILDPDLSEITFNDKGILSEGAVLRNEGMDLSNVNFQGANLRGANFYAGNRQGVNLANANLREADLTGANLWEANLSGADLTGANLRGANLSGADLAFANVTNTDFQDVVFKDTNLTGTMLWRAKIFPEQLTLHPHPAGNAARNTSRHFRSDRPAAP